MKYKVCSRCQFRVPATLKLCQVCGNRKWLVNSARPNETGSFGLQDDNPMLKFKHKLSEVLLGAAVALREEEARQPVELELAWEESTSPDTTALHRIVELGGETRQDHKINTTDRDVAELKKEIEEISKWFRSYGSKGLLTNRG